MSATASHEIVSHIVHDLQNPLTAIQGYAQMILMTSAESLPAAVTKNLNTVLISCGQLRRMLVTLSYHSALVAGEHPLGTQRISASEILKKSMEEMAGFASAQNKSLRITEAPADSAFQGDPELIDLALQGLIANSLARIRTGGEIKLGAEKDGATGRIVLFLEDTGPHIPEEFREPYFAAEEVGRIKEAGLKTDRALALPFAKAVALAHRGVAGVTATGQTTRTFLQFPPA